jgi:hypothetical protein
MCLRIILKKDTNIPDFQLKNLFFHYHKIGTDKKEFHITHQQEHEMNEIQYCRRFLYELSKQQ